MHERTAPRLQPAEPVDWTAEWPFMIVAGLALAVLGLSWATGTLTGQAAPDTAGYLATATSPDRWGGARHPLYGTLALWLGATAEATGHVALAQAVLHGVAALTVYAGARLAGLGMISAALLSASALLAQSAFFHVRLLVPEAPATAFLLLAFAGALGASRSPRLFWILLVPTGLAAALAYVLRPVFLPAIAVLPLLFLIFAKRNGQHRCLVRAAVLLVAVAAPFLIQASIRQRAVGDFNIVSFGGFQMSALAGLMLTPDAIPQLPDAVRPTAQAILAAREAAEAEERVARTPRNSAGERSFVSAALGYFDVYARSYDDVLGEVAKLHEPGETWVAFNRRLMAFSLATVIASPGRWAAWVGGATARLVGRSLITNAVMLPAVAALCIVVVPATRRRSGLGPSGRDVAPVIVIVLAWLAVTAPLAVLVTFPATRYIDTVGVLLPAVPAVLAAAMIEALCCRQSLGNFGTA